MVPVTGLSPSYGEFLKALCEPRDKAVLWHCTAGKDRAGFAAVLIEYILGVDRDSIMEDYLYTNECIAGKNGNVGPSLDELLTLSQTMVKDEASREKIAVMFRERADKIRECTEYLYGAKEEFLGTLLDAIDETYGSLDQYLSKGLGVSSEMRDELRKLYLD